MNKDEFLARILSRLEGLPDEDIQQSVDYYSEIIEDKVEDGMTEEEAIQAIGSPEDIAEQILMDTPLPKLVKAKVKPKSQMKVWMIVLLVLGSPVWLPLLIAAAAVLLSVYIVLWSVVLVLYAVDFSFSAAALACLAGGFAFCIRFSLLDGIFTLGTALVFAGLAVLMFFGFNQITKGMLFISKKIITGIKSCFVKRS